MLAVALTRHAAFADQVCRGVPYQAVLEDDMALQPSWPSFIVQEARSRFARSSSSAADSLDLVQLGRYAEGYLTSLAGAARLLQRYNTSGIVRCADQQLNDKHIMNLSKTESTAVPWRNLRKANSKDGDIAKAPFITRAERRALRCLTARGQPQDPSAAWTRFKQLVAHGEALGEDGRRERVRLRSVARGTHLADDEHTVEECAVPVREPEPEPEGTSHI